MNRQLINNISRLIIGVLIGYIGIAFAGTDREFLALITLLIAFAIVVPGSGAIIVSAFVALLCVGGITLILWSPYGIFEGTSYFEWAADNWWNLIFLVGMTLFAVVNRISQENQTWKLLDETYGTPAEPDESLNSRPGTRGTMQVDDDMYFVETYLVPSGIRVRDADDQQLLFPWHRMVEVRPNAEIPTSAEIFLRTSSGMLRPIRLPWSPEFQERVPDLSED